MMIYSVLMYPQAITLLTPLYPIAKSDANLTVLTWNILGGRANQSCIIDTLMRYEPDVVMFQEAGGFDIEAVMLYPYKVKSTNLVILSKFEMMNPVEFGRHPLNGHDSGLQVEMQFAGASQAITLINSYLPKPFVVPSQLIYKAQDRIDATSRYLEAIEQAKGEVILTGDHNMGMRAPEYVRLSQHLQDTWLEGGRGFGFTANQQPIIPPLLRVDYIWHSDGITSASVEVIQSVCSDHLAVMAGFQVR